MARDPQNFAAWLAEHPPAEEAFTQTLAGATARVKGGASFQHAMREFLDEFSLRPTDALRLAALAECPAPTGERRYDAYLGALAEHLAAAHGLDRPAWSLSPERFLDVFWFPSAVAGFRAIAIAASPAAFRRRGIFLGPGALDRT